MRTGWETRFLSSTRGHIASLLRHTPRTVDELAQTLGVTRTAVRSHLTALERDGLVRRAGVRRGESKPFYLYELSPQAERLFPKPYGTVLAELLRALASRFQPRALEPALREVGHHLSAAHPKPAGDRRARLGAAEQVLNELGGLPEVEQAEGGWVIRSHSCPLAVAVSAYPRVCLVVETLLADLIGTSVHELCDHAEPPRCAFEVAA